MGPDQTFLKYQADAHVVPLNELAVFSAGVSNESIGLEFKLDIDFTYLLNRDEIGLVHKESARSYPGVILSRTKAAIKNEATFVTFQQYFQQRKEVEQRFRKAVQSKWNEKPEVHATLDQFHLGRIRIPNSVAEKQLEAKIQVERNDREDFLQKAQVEREMTAVEVNQIALETEKLMRTAKAEAHLLVAKAKVEATQMKVNAETNGTMALVGAAGINNQEHLSAFSYIRTLSNRDEVEIDVNYLTPDNVVKTRQV